MKKPLEHETSVYRNDAAGSDPAKKQKNDKNYEDQSNSAAWIISPISAMRPPRQDSQKSKNQNHNQYSSKHTISLYFCFKQKY
jgi:hypothetical protein